MRRGIFIMDVPADTTHPCPVALAKELRVVAFIDAMNLFNQAKRCWNYQYPNFDPILLSERIGLSYPNRVLTNIRLYTGIHKVGKNRNKYWFWKNKIAEHEKDPRFEAFVTTLAYSEEEIPVKDAATGEVRLVLTEIAREKGTDVNIGVDLYRLANDNHYDVAIIFSQDRDLTGSVESVRKIRVQSGRVILLECAFPVNDALSREYKRGIPNTKWIEINKTDYDACIDPKDYRPKKFEPGSLFEC
jgi:uncharacterized LabA/DUF88 family protein